MIADNLKTWERLQEMAAAVGVELAPHVGNIFSVTTPAGTMAVQGRRGIEVFLSGYRMGRESALATIKQEGM